MSDDIIQIRTDKFSKDEIRVIEGAIQDWEYDWIVDFFYACEDKEENVVATFKLQRENLGEFLWVVFGCGHEFTYRTGK